MLALINSFHYLNAGVGNDCPKHNMAKSVAADLVISCSRPPDILGDTLPTGSENDQHLKHVKMAPLSNWICPNVGLT